MNEEKDHLVLKWGTLKMWKFHSKRAGSLLKEYGEIGSSESAIMQHDTSRQKEILCELIDEGDFKKVYLDWEDKDVTKKQAKKYINTYGS